MLLSRRTLSPVSVPPLFDFLPRSFVQAMPTQFAFLYRKSLVQASLSFSVVSNFSRPFLGWHSPPFPIPLSPPSFLPLRFLKRGSSPPCRRPSLFLIFRSFPRPPPRFFGPLRHHIKRFYFCARSDISRCQVGFFLNLSLFSSSGLGPHASDEVSFRRRCFPPPRTIPLRFFIPLYTFG